MPNFNENKPIGTDLLSDLPSLLTNNAIAFRAAVEKHSYWTDASGVSAGDMRLSDGSSGPGSARAYFDVASNFTGSLATVKPLSGRLYIASDTSRLYTYDPQLSGVLIGGTRTIVYRVSTATIPSNVRTLIQTGTQTAVGISTQTITFPNAYGDIPNIQATVFTTALTDYAMPLIKGSTTTCFGLSIATLFGATASAYTVVWRSHGTTTL